MKKLLEFHSAHERPGNELEFKFQPAVDRALWKAANELHPKTMLLAHTLQGKAAQSRVGALSQEGITIIFPLFLFADWAHTGSSQKLCKGDLASLIIPSSSYLYELDPDNKVSVDRLKKEIKRDQLMYEYLLCSDKIVQGKIVLL